MDVQQEIESRMEKIRALFQYALSVSLDEEGTGLESELNSTENEFRSIAYEAAAMNFALKDISGDHKFTHWQMFMRGPGMKHLTQVHIGLGWAIAQQQVSIFPFIETIEPLMQCRVLDGYGYYEGIFRKRKTIVEKQSPQELGTTFLHGYDQGAGRSIWYNCKGDCEKISEMVAAFPSSRQRDLWRGIGIACAYVGGFDEKLLRQLFAAAADHRIQLSIGAALVSKTRTEAGSYTRYIDMACREWCKCSGEEALNIAIKTEPLADSKIADPCDTWISNLEAAFSGVKIKG